MALHCQLILKLLVKISMLLLQVKQQTLLVLLTICYYLFIVPSSKDENTTGMFYYVYVGSHVPNDIVSHFVVKVLMYLLLDLTKIE